MSIGPTKLERESLEAHVDLCALRYDELGRRLNTVEDKIDSISQDMKHGQNSLSKVIIGSASTISASLLSIVIVLLMQ